MEGVDDVAEQDVGEPGVAALDPGPDLGPGPEAASWFRLWAMIRSRTSSLKPTVTLTTCSPSTVSAFEAIRRT